MSMNFCKNFVTLRRVHGYTQETIAEKCGVSRQAIAKWEAGASLPDMYKLVDIAKLFDVSMDDLVCGNCFSGLDALPALMDEMKAMRSKLDQIGARIPCSDQEDELYQNYLDTLDYPDEDDLREWGDFLSAGIDIRAEFRESGYEKAWDMMVDGIREVADYAPDMKISIEYKPFEERSFAMVDSTGMTMLLIEEVDRPNVGCTLDFCHMLMKNDSPSYGIAHAARRGKLFGLHMNDGYGKQDNGLIFASVNIGLCAEFVYYLKKYHYTGVVFFDTFPRREEAAPETQANIDAFEKISHLIDEIGVDNISDVVSKCDGVSASKLILSLLK